MAALPVQLRGSLSVAPAPLARGARSRLVVTRAAESYSPASLRPYTIRKGDTLDSIAKKRSLTTKDVLSYNKKLDAKKPVAPGQTILLPTFKLSDRDREILKGIAPTGARTYPMRAGEKLSDVLKGRGVTMAEAQALNPGVDLAKVKDGQLVKLPYGRYTQREKEMLSSVVPATSLGLPSTVSFSQGQLQFGLLAALAVAAYAFYVKQAAAWSEKDQ